MTINADAIKVIRNIAVSTTTTYTASNLQRFNHAMLKHAQPQPHSGCSLRLGHAHLGLHVGACFVVPQLLLRPLLFLGNACLPRFV